MRKISHKRTTEYRKNGMIGYIATNVSFKWQRKAQTLEIKAGSRDDVEVLSSKDGVLVVSWNEGLGYLSLQWFTIGNESELTTDDSQEIFIDLSQDFEAYEIENWENDPVKAAKRVFNNCIF